MKMDMETRYKLFVLQCKGCTSVHIKRPQSGVWGFIADILRTRGCF